MTARPQYLTYTLAAADTDGIANDLTGAGPFTPNVASGPADGLAHQLSLSSSANLSAIDMTVAGTDADGRAITEVIAGPNNNTVESTGFFKTVTSITAASTLGANTMDVGWVDEATTPTIPLELYLKEGPCFCQINLNGGTVGFDIEGTLDNLYETTSPPPSQSDHTWLNDANFTAKSADIAAQLAIVWRAIRLVINSYSSAPTINLNIITPR